MEDLKLINEIFEKLINNSQCNMQDFKKTFSYPFNEFYGSTFFDIKKNSPFLDSIDDEILKNFTPNTIYNYRILYYNGDEHDGKSCPGDKGPWSFICEFSYDNEIFYGFYDASCSYTGFDACGEMSFYNSKDLKNLITYAIGNYERDRIFGKL